MSKQEAKLFGEAMANAFGHCLHAGGKASSGTKLSKELWQVYSAAQPQTSQPKVKDEEVKSQVTEAKEEPTLKRCLSSPSKIRELYGSTESGYEKRAKVAHTYVHDTLVHSWPMQILHPWPIHVFRDFRRRHEHVSCILPSPPLLSCARNKCVTRWKTPQSRVSYQ